MLVSSVLPRVWWAVVVAAIAFSAPAQSQDASPILGSEDTQSVALEVGPNLVSLRVHPDDRSFDAIFGSDLDRVLFIKDARGVTFAPRYGVSDLPGWAWGEALLVHVEDAFTLEVTGSRILSSSEIVLGEGWSWIPVFLDQPTPVETALSTIAASLSTVEDVDGRAYPDGDPALATIEPGQGYRVHLDAAATLRYGTPPTGRQTYRVATIEDA
ncbi:MAG: hypothetical protein WBA11_04785, partial [Rubrivirga sp.]